MNKTHNILQTARTACHSLYELLLVTYTEDCHRKYFIKANQNINKLKSTITIFILLKHTIINNTKISGSGHHVSV